MSQLTRSVWVGFNPKRQMWWRRRGCLTPSFDQAELFLKKQHLASSVGRKQGGVKNARDNNELIEIEIMLEFDPETYTLIALGGSPNQIQNSSPKY